MTGSDAAMPAVRRDQHARRHRVSVLPGGCDHVHIAKKLRNDRFDGEDDERRSDDSEQRARRRRGDADEMAQTRPVTAVRCKARVEQSAFEQRQQKLREHDADDRHEVQRKIACEHHQRQHGEYARTALP